MDVAPANNANIQVTTIGTEPKAILPPEVDYNITTLDQETRYLSTNKFRNTPIAITDLQNFLFNINNSSNFLRLRACQLSTTFNFTSTTANIPPTAITPLFGHSLTFWDQILLSLGTNSTQAITNTQLYGKMAAIQYVAARRKNRAAINVWDVNAGYEDVVNFDYAGGIASNATGLLTNTPGNYMSYLINQQLGANASPAFNQTNGSTTGFAALIPALSQGNNYYPPYYNRIADPGLWYDPAMQRLKARFIPNSNITNFTTLTHMALLNSLFDTICLLPPTRWKLAFTLWVNRGSRLLVTPSVAFTQIQAGPPATGTMGLVPASQPANLAVTINMPTWYFYTDSIDLRYDLQNAFIVAYQKAPQGGISLPMYVYTLTTGVITQGSTNTQFIIIQQQGNLPFYSFFCTQPSSFTNNLPPNTAAAQAPNNYSEFAYGSNGITMISMNITQPNNRTIQMRNDYVPLPPTPLNVFQNINGGVYNPEIAINELGQRSQYLFTPDHADVDTYSPLTWWMPECQAMVPTGSYVTGGTAVTLTTIYGSHSVLNANANTVLNAGPHNQVWIFNYSCLGYIDAKADLGVYKGELSYNLTSLAAQQTINLYSIQVYQIQAAFIGSNYTATTNLQITTT